MSYYTYLASFMWVYRTGSFSKAASGLSLSQPAITQHISALESRFRKRLFDRHSRKVTPTPFAHMLYSIVSSHIDELDKALGLRGFPENVGEYTFTIGGPPDMLESFIVPGLSKLVAKGYKFFFKVDEHSVLIEKLKKGDIDFVIGYQDSLPELESVIIGQRKFLLVGVEKFLERTEKTLASGISTDVSNLPWIIYQEALCFLQEYLVQEFGCKGTKMKPALVIKDFHCVLEALLNGVGIGLVPQYLCNKHLKSKRLTLMHKPSRPLLRTICLYYINTLTQDPVYSTLIEYILSESEKALG